MAPTGPGRRGRAGATTLHLSAVAVGACGGGADAPGLPLLVLSAGYRHAGMEGGRADGDA